MSVLEQHGTMIQAMQSQFLQLGQQLANLNSKLTVNQVVQQVPVEVHRDVSGVDCFPQAFSLRADDSFDAYNVQEEDDYLGYVDGEGDDQGLQPEICDMDVVQGATTVLPLFSGTPDLGVGSGGPQAVPISSGSVPNTASPVVDDLDAAFISALFGQNVLDGAPFPEGFAKQLNENLRVRPCDAKVRELVKEIKWPVNVENFKVPEVNKGVAKAMTPIARSIDGKMAQTTMLLSKSLVPLSKMIMDAIQSPHKEIGGYREDLQKVFNILIAGVNYEHNIRKALICNWLKNHVFARFCTWDHPVGSSLLFPDDVLKKCAEEVKKSFNLRGSFRGRGMRRGFQGRGTNRGSTSWYGRGQHNGRSNAPFLGRGPRRARGRQ